MKLLFVCSRNRMRSPTAETIFAGQEGLETMSAGTSPDAVTSVSADSIEWADLILVMENAHRQKLKERFGPLLRAKRIVVLGIPDRFQFMQPELIRTLKEKFGRFLPKG